jgi:hypothetical protein
MVRLLAARNQPLYDSLIEFRLAPKALLKSVRHRTDSPQRTWGIAPGFDMNAAPSALNTYLLDFRPRISFP